MNWKHCLWLFESAKLQKKNQNILWINFVGSIIYFKRETEISNSVFKTEMIVIFTLLYWLRKIFLEKFIKKQQNISNDLEVAEKRSYVFI